MLRIQHSGTSQTGRATICNDRCNQTINFCENIRRCDSVMRIAADQANNSLHIESIASTLQKLDWPQLVSYWLNYNGRHWRYLIRRTLISLYMYGRYCSKFSSPHIVELAFFLFRNSLVRLLHLLPFHSFHFEIASSYCSMINVKQICEIQYEE